MELMEYKARELFSRYGIPVNESIHIDCIDGKDESSITIGYPVVVKAQVPTGGRGKAGGIRFAQDFTQLKTAASDILGMNIKGYDTESVLIVKKAEITREFYLSITVDRDRKCPMILFSREGGVDIEETARNTPEAVKKIHIDTCVGCKAYVARYVSVMAGLNKGQAEQMRSLISSLYKLFLEQNALLCEINPLAVTDSGDLLAIDGKITIDDSAIKRSTEMLDYSKQISKDQMVIEAEAFGFLYIPCNKSGNVAVMSNGSGMLMSCIDIITRNGMEVRAVLDMGGGSVSDRICEGIRILLTDEKTDVLFLNIFGGITRCDEVANGISHAIRKYGIDKPIIVRLEGTNKDKGLEMISPISQVVIVDSITEGVTQLLRKGKQK